jgi:phosphatidylinositol-3-phosphatase
LTSLKTRRASLSQLPVTRLPVTRLLRAAVLCAAAPLALSVVAAAPAGALAAPAPAVRFAQIPDYSHIVLVIEENKAYSEIIGSSKAPYINSLASEGALFTQSYGITYPSEPNYMALLAGSTFGLTADTCPFSTSAANLGSELLAAGLSYAGYSESMPRQGYEGCNNGEYARKHNPTANCTDLPKTVNKTFAEFPTDYADLPTVSFVDPNLVDDMHSASITMGDTWLQDNMSGYINWAMNNNSLFILTWDTDNGKSDNHIPTLFVGANIVPGQYSETINDYNVLRTIEQAYGLPYAGNSATATPITDVFS